MVGSRSPMRIVVVLAGCVCAVHPVHADRVEACATAAEEAQSLRADGRLSAARERLAFCSQTECPAAVRVDCERWIAEVDASLPFVVIAARDSNGRDLTNVRVLVDGVVVTERLEGRAIGFDPGPHRLRFESPGYEPVEQDVVILERDKDRRIEVRFERAASSSVGKPSTDDQRRGLPMLAIVSGASGLTALGVFGVLAITGQRDVDACRDAGGCSESDVDSLRLRRNIAWASLGVATLALTIATISGVRARAAPSRASPHVSAFDIQLELSRRSVLDIELDWQDLDELPARRGRLTYVITPIAVRAESLFVSLGVGAGVVYGDHQQGPRAPLGLDLQFRRIPLAISSELALQLVRVDGRPHPVMNGGITGRLWF